MSQRHDHAIRFFAVRMAGIVLLASVSAAAQQAPASAQAPGVLVQQPGVLVIEGGTLIDGNGGAPVQDSVIVIRGNRITNVSRKGQIQYPAGARILKADGKFILPGLFDSHVLYNWYYGEAMLNLGVTSTIDNGLGAELSVPHREAVMHGKVLGPRTFTGIAFLASRHEALGGWADWTGFESALAPAQVPKSVEEVREMVKLRIAAGADYIIFQDGNLPPEYYRAGFDEANRAGTPVFVRAAGPNLFPKDAALLGAANLPHSAGIGAAIAKNGAPRDGESRSSELDRYAEMDDGKAKDLIQLLVQHGVALVPTFSINFPGYPRDWARFEQEDRGLFSDRNLAAYYPERAIQSALASYSRIDRGAVRERRIKGFRNALRFHKMFVDAGGHLVVSANTNDSKTPGLSLHHEMEILTEAGIAPMQIIQGATKWAAAMIRKQDILGTVETGKLADLVIVNDDPIQNIYNLQNIDAVIFDGKIVDRAYHPWYTTPFLNRDGLSPTVDGLSWAAAWKKVMSNLPGRPSARGESTLPDPPESPQPAIEKLDPVIVTEGSPPLVLTIEGFNFVRRSLVYFGGKPVPYKAVSPTELQVSLDASLLRAVGRFDVVVKNPAPLDPLFGQPAWGNGTSNTGHLLIDYKY